MNDRFKFRVWDSSANAYVPRSQFILLSDGTLIQEIGGEEVIWESTQPEFCTGLKDKNGKLIYEGDILKITDQMIDYIVEVYWDKGMFCYDITPNSANLVFCDLTDNETTVEVIGNIHKNAVYESKEKQHTDDAIAYNELAEENAKLIELLGECLAHLSNGELGASVTPLNFVIEKIKEVLK